MVREKGERRKDNQKGWGCRRLHCQQRNKAANSEGGRTEGRKEAKERKVRGRELTFRALSCFAANMTSRGWFNGKEQERVGPSVRNRPLSVQ